MRGRDICTGVVTIDPQVAFRNPDGSTVVLVDNDDWGTGSQRFNMKMGSESLCYDLPAGAVATFVIDRPR